MIPIDAVKALSFGAIGLSFLFGFLAYLLIRNLQNESQKPLVKGFMWLAFALCVTSFALEAYRQSKIDSELAQVRKDIDRVNEKLESVCALQASSWLDDAGEFRSIMAKTCNG